MKLATKIIFLFCLVSVTCVPIYMWAFTNGAIDMSGIGGFIAGSAAPLGVLTGAMAARNIARARNGEG